MIVLGIDTATSSTAVALRIAPGESFEARDDPSAGERPGHSTRLLGLASELLDRAGLDWTAVQRIAVGRGPGTFTGLRIGIASARGLAHSLGVELVGVSSLRVLSEQAFAAERQRRSEPAAALRVLAVLDARRGEAFVGAYGLNSRLLNARELARALTLSPERLDEAVSRDAPHLAVGDGAVRYRAQLEDAGALVPEDSSPLHLLSASVLCEIAAGSEASELSAVLPDYVRRPDAEIALEAQRR